MPSTKSIASTPSTSPIKRALFLSVFLFTVFLIATGLYARYGYAFALWVFEKQQLATSLNSEGKPRPTVYRDYLRVDPANLRMRGIFINELIRVNGTEEALLVAQEGVAAVPPDQRPIAKLLVGRAQMALGKLDEAESTYNDVLETLGESGEAHYGLAQIAAAYGNFETMRQEFERFKETMFNDGGTPDFLLDTRHAAASSDDNWPTDVSKEPEHIRHCYLALSFERTGTIDTTLERLGALEVWTDAPRAALFWRGVYEEEQGNREAALDFYRRAAKPGNALGRFAVLRLNTPPVPPQQ